MTFLFDSQRKIMENINIGINFNKICRSCLSTEGEMNSIYNTVTADNKRIVDLLEICSFIQVLEGDEFPTQVCFRCCSLIQQAYEFKLQCQNSTAVLQSLVKGGIIKLEENEYNTNNYIALEVTNTIIEFKCSKCNEIFSSATDLDSHKTFHLENDNKCPKCFKLLKNEQMLIFHLRHCKTFECQTCKKTFRTIGYFQNHMKKHDPNYVPEEKKFKCFDCNKCYTSPANLTIHQYSHSGIKPFKCEFCEKGFTKMVALNSHIALHTGKRSHLCSECGRGFTSTSILNQHKKIHSGERPYKCKICNRGFTASGDLRIHLRCHTGEKPYLCPTCGRGFARITHLNIHSRTHTGERPYICGDCGKGFAQSGDLKSHQRTHTGERPYACNLCSKRFAQSSALNSHISTHDRIKAHVCKVCNRSFAKSTSLIRHSKTHL